MIEAVWNGIVSFFLIALVAVSVQNSVLSRALNVSRLISLDNPSDAVVFGVLLAAVTTLSSIMFYLINFYFLQEHPYASLLRPAAMMVCMAISFFAVFVIVVKLVPYIYVGKATELLPSASFNCTVVSSILIPTIAGFELFEMVAFGIGSAAGFVLAALLVTEGQRKLQNRSVPAAFRGLPATLLYIAGLALAVYGLTGHTLSF